MLPERPFKRSDETWREREKHTTVPFTRLFFPNHSSFYEKKGNPRNQVDREMVKYVLKNESTGRLDVSCLENTPERYPVVDPSPVSLLIVTRPGMEFSRWTRTGDLEEYRPSYTLVSSLRTVVVGLRGILGPKRIKTFVISSSKIGSVSRIPRGD